VSHLEQFGSREVFGDIYEVFEMQLVGSILANVHEKLEFPELKRHSKTREREKTNKSIENQVI